MAKTPSKARARAKSKPAKASARSPTASRAKRGRKAIRLRGSQSASREKRSAAKRTAGAQGGCRAQSASLGAPSKVKRSAPRAWPSGDSQPKFRPRPSLREPIRSCGARSAARAGAGRASRRRLPRKPPAERPILDARRGGARAQHRPGDRAGRQGAGRLSDAARERRDQGHARRRNRRDGRAPSAGWPNITWPIPSGRWRRKRR